MAPPDDATTSDSKSDSERNSVWDIVTKPGVIPALNKIAHQRRLGWSGLSWGTDDLTHETLIRMQKLRNLPPVEDRAEFEKVFSCTIQRILADKYRKKNAKKRKGWIGKTVHYMLNMARRHSEHDTDLAGLVENYIQNNPLPAVIVWMSVEYGLSIDEMAVALNMKPDSVERKLRRARAELHRELDPHDDRPG